MKILDSLANLFIDVSNISIIENFYSVEIITNSSDYTIPTKEEIEYLISFLSSSDVISIFITDYGMSIATYHSDISDITLDNFVETLTSKKCTIDADSEIRLKIRIDKKIDDNKINVYSFNSFIDYLNTLDLETLMKSFSSLLGKQPHIFFKLVDSDLKLYTKTLFFDKTLNDSNIENISRDELLNKRNNICSFLDASKFKTVPEDFHIIRKNGDSDLDKLLSKLSLIHSLIYISNLSKIDNRNSLLCKIDGYKQIQNYLTFNQMDYKNCTNFYSIYEWIYNGGNLSDKMGLARNIITLHSNNNDLLNIDKNTLSSIQSSHEIYLKQNVQQYIDVKNKVTEHLFELSYKSNDLVDSFLNSIKNNSMLFVTFFISVVILNSLSGNNFTQIFTKDITVISFIILIGSLLFLIANIWEVNRKYIRFHKSYERLKLSYKDILDENDINEIFSNDKYHDEDLLFIKNKTITYSVVWISLLIIIGSGIWYLS